MTTQSTPEAQVAPPRLANPRKLFVNIPVSDLGKSVAFFTRLGFTFNPQFTDETATCMLVGEDAYFMLLTRPRFAEFAKRPVSDPSMTTGALFALSTSTRAEVDTLVETAIAAGGRHAADPMDHGFMYAWSFFDLDGHHWEVFWMDPAHVE